MDWLGGTVLSGGNISEPDPGLVTVTDDVEEAVALATSLVAPGPSRQQERGPDGRKSASPHRSRATESPERWGGAPLVALACVPRYGMMELAPSTITDWPE